MGTYSKNAAINIALRNVDMQRDTFYETCRKIRK
jgi:hypothetical protein